MFSVSAYWATQELQLLSPGCHGPSGWSLILCAQSCLHPNWLRHPGLCWFLQSPGQAWLWSLAMSPLSPHSALSLPSPINQFLWNSLLQLIQNETPIFLSAVFEVSNKVASLTNIYFSTYYLPSMLPNPPYVCSTLYVLQLLCEGGGGEY